MGSPVSASYRPCVKRDQRLSEITMDVAVPVSSRTKRRNDRPIQLQDTAYSSITVGRSPRSTATGSQLVAIRSSIRPLGTSHAFSAAMYQHLAFRVRTSAHAADAHRPVSTA